MGSLSVCMTAGRDPARVRAILELVRPVADEIVLAADERIAADVHAACADLTDRRLSLRVQVAALALHRLDPPPVLGRLDPAPRRRRGAEPRPARRAPAARRQPPPQLPVAAVPPPLPRPRDLPGEPPLVPRLPRAAGAQRARSVALQRPLASGGRRCSASTAASPRRPSTTCATSRPPRRTAAPPPSATSSWCRAPPPRRTRSTRSTCPSAGAACGSPPCPIATAS